MRSNYDKCDICKQAIHEDSFEEHRKSSKCTSMQKCCSIWSTVKKINYQRYHFLLQNLSKAMTVVHYVPFLSIKINGESIWWVIIPVRIILEINQEKAVSLILLKYNALMNAKYVSFVGSKSPSNSQNLSGKITTPTSRDY